MDNRVYIGTRLLENKLYLASSLKKEDLISILLITDSEHLESDLLKLSNDMGKQIYGADKRYV